MIKCVLFDLDGVLVDACEWHYQSLNEALFEVSNIKISRKSHIKTFNGLPTSKKLDILSKEGKVDKKLHNIIWEKKQLHTVEIIKKFAKHDKEKVNMLSSLLEMNILLGCVTNSIRETAELMLSKTGQFNYFKKIITNEDVKHPKPHPEGYISAMKYFNVSPLEVLIIEDSEKGFESAKLSGAHAGKVDSFEKVNYDQVKNMIDQTNNCDLQKLILL